MAIISVEVDLADEINFYSLEDAKGDDLIGDLTWELDSDNDIIATLKEHYIVDSNDYELLQKAQELTESDWELLAMNQLMEDES